MSEAKVLVAQSDTGSTLPVTRADFTALSDQRKLLMEYVRNQLNKDVDFGTIPGTPKPTLYKPGAEKLRALFTLEPGMTLVEKEIDRRENFAMYTYKCTVKKNGVVIGECEASCNSQEKKYKERKIYKNGKPQGSEAVPVCDILNTLQKMAQKRAFVGAIIIAIGASDFFNQDLDDVDDAEGLGVIPKDQKDVTPVPSAINVSGSPQAHARQSQGLGDFIMPMGRVKGQRLADCSKEELDGFLGWAVKQEQPSQFLKQTVAKVESFLEGA